jgi:D-serine deaminase-like pyridoxal phosphate-dependent protein
MAAAAERHGTRLDVLVEINVGASRCGVDPGEPAAALAQLIAREKHLRFAGLQAYQGRAQHFRTIEERRAAIDEAVARSAATVKALKAAGLSCDIVGGAGTGTFELEAASGVYNELQAGSYIFMDADYARNKRADGGPYDTFEHALFVYATVMPGSRASRSNPVHPSPSALRVPCMSAPPTSTAISIWRRPTRAPASATKCASFLATAIQL